MKRYIQSIHINRLFHISDLEIPVSDDSHYNLIITGKNGSGKTVLLNAIVDFFNRVKSDSHLNFTNLDNTIKFYEDRLAKATTDDQRFSIEQRIKHYKNENESLYGRVVISFNNIADIIHKYQHDEFILAFYSATRNSRMVEPKNPTKPLIEKKGNIDKSVTPQFLNFLSDLKIQEALARNEGQLKDADEIGAWFSEFEKLLQKLFEDPSLKLVFNYRDYSFVIHSKDKAFKFTQLSDGFSAVLDIIADLILKIQNQNSLVRSYKKEGIVLIDEIETHLHLQLQKAILPLLINLFPNIQFIVTTHSPFVLNSIDSATVYDLENHSLIKEGLSNASYSGIVEGYFKQDELSADLREKLESYRELTQKKELADDDYAKIAYLEPILEEIPDYLDPGIALEFRRLKVEFERREDLL